MWNEKAHLKTSFVPHYHYTQITATLLAAFCTPLQVNVDDIDPVTCKMSLWSHSPDKSPIKAQCVDGECPSFVPTSRA